MSGSMPRAGSITSRGTGHMVARMRAATLVYARAGVRAEILAGGNGIRTIGPAPAKGSSGRCQSETAARKAEPTIGSGPRQQCLPGVVRHSLSLRGGTPSSNPSSSSAESAKSKRLDTGTAILLGSRSGMDGSNPPPSNGESANYRTVCSEACGL